MLRNAPSVNVEPDILPGAGRNSREAGHGLSHGFDTVIIRA